MELSEAIARCPELALLLDQKDRRDRQQQQRIEDLERRVSWLSTQVFGEKSEKLAAMTLSQEQQMWLFGEILPVPAEPPPADVTVNRHQRARRQNPIDLARDDSQLRFGKDVPVQEIEVEDPATASIPPEHRELVSEKVVCKLARRSSHVVLQYTYRTYKDKRTGTLLTPRAADSVIPGSSADVSFLVGLLVDKFKGHLPLYRQHQRLKDEGIFLDRATLTRLVHGTMQHLEPIYQALQGLLLSSTIVAADESPTPAGKAEGKMRQGYYWAFCSGEGDVVFLFSPSRATKVLSEGFLKNYQGVLLSDGYAAYSSFAAGRPGIVHATCWTHARRNFIEAEPVAKDQCRIVLATLQQLYQVEQRAELGSVELARLRDTVSRKIVAGLFEYLDQQIADSCFAPSNAFVKAAQYMLARRTALRVFLDDPAVPLDTNHVERQIRGPVVGRKNWMFHSTETGARYGAMAYSLIHSCTLAGVDATTYLTDVLQRIGEVPATDAHLLVPRLWAKNFASNPLRTAVIQ